MKVEGMEIRDLQAVDIKAVRVLHEASGLDYILPDFQSPLVVWKRVAEVDGEIVAAGCLRLQAEAFIWVKDGASPLVKWKALKAFQREATKLALAFGIEIVAYVPDCIGRFFEKRMKQLNWTKIRDGWTPWNLEVHK